MDFYELYSWIVDGFLNDCLLRVIHIVQSGTGVCSGL